MPSAPPRQCRKPGCPDTTTAPDGYCPSHTRPPQDNRPNFRERGYNYRWDKARKVFLSKHPWCNHCQAPANVVDHITPHRGSNVLFWDQRNWQPLCTLCHNRKTGGGE
jgi:5-methylcytosine-specific restriction protein A